MAPRSPLHAIAAATHREQLLFALRAGYHPGMSELPDKLSAIVDAVTVFERAGVDYALIGGLAVGIRTGVPRATLDVDFAIPTHADRRALAEEMQRAGFSSRGEFAHSMNFQQRSGEPVQLAFDPQFDPMIARAEPVQLDDLVLRVVTKDDLVAMKRRAAADPARRRSKALRDEADIALLEGDLPGPDEGW